MKNACVLIDFSLCGLIRWVFWFRQQRAPGNKITNYEEGIKKISPFSSVRLSPSATNFAITSLTPTQVESFWSLWTHLQPPSNLVPTTDYLLFHSGVRRPVWEDPLNLSGGKWIIRLKKGVSDRIWEDLILGIIGDQFDECTPDREHEEGNDANDSWSEGGENAEEWPEICGATLSVRQSEDILSVWNRVDRDMKLREKIRSVMSAFGVLVCTNKSTFISDTIRRVLNLPASTIMEYKSNNGQLFPSLVPRVPYIHFIVRLHARQIKLPKLCHRSNALVLIIAHRLNPCRMYRVHCRLPYSLFEKVLPVL